MSVAEYLYDEDGDPVLLTEEEEKIMRAMRRVNSLFKSYKAKAGTHNLILFGGSCGCSMRYGTPSKENIIQTFEFITSDGGDGGDIF